MEEQERRKGTVTSIASMYPVEEAQRAAKGVEEAILHKQNELNNLNQFISDNNNLITLISRLPDELHHDVMVPFGKAAFFPGKLIHTNELVVLLGEGYYAERTAKQTVEILKRRGKVLDSQFESLNSNIKDLRAEASFFNSTASEAAEGLVEIREDYVEESSNEGPSKSETDEKKVGVEDDEYARMMSRLDELEKEELEAEGNNESDGDTAESDNERDEIEHTDIVESVNESNEDELTYKTNSDSDSYAHTQSIANFNRFSSQTHSEIRKPQNQPKVENASMEALSNYYQRQLDIADQPNCTGLTVQPIPKDDVSNSKNLTHLNKFIPTGKAVELPAMKKETEAVTLSSNEAHTLNSKSKFDSSRAFTGSIVEHSTDLQTFPKDQVATSSKPKAPGFDSSKAFTGSIVERTNNIPTSHGQSTNSSQSSNSQPSKPVSRFKMQRR